jgi:lysophospholipase L1-like esterase
MIRSTMIRTTTMRTTTVRTAKARRVMPLLAVIAAVVAFGAAPGASAQETEGARWVTAWATSQQGLGTTTITNATVRMIARVTVGGESVRVRLDNTFGTDSLVIRAAYVGAVMRRAALTPGSNLPVRFGGSPSVTIAPGGTVESDPVPMRVIARQDLAVSLYIPAADVRPSQHGQANVTSYLSESGSGNLAAAESAEAFTETTTSTFWLKAIDVRSESATGTVVGFGDSITDGTCTTLDAHDRWEDWLAARLYLAAPDAHPAIVNEGIGGNTVSGEGLRPPPNSPPGIERLDRDVLSHTGVTHVVLFMGTNDIRRESSAEQLIAGMQEIAERVQARGMTVIGATIIPRHNRAPTATNSGWTPAKTRIRREVNDWIRGGGAFDGVIDFDAVVRDPADPDRIAPAFDCDGIHPNPRGYFEMGGAVPLELFAP